MSTQTDKNSGSALAQAEIITPRLVLRGVTPGLIRSLFETRTPEEIRQFFNVEEEGFDHLRAMYEKGMETHRLSHFYFLLHEKATGEVIGDCGFHTWNSTHRRAELFYTLRHDRYKRQGLMSEALPPVISYGFGRLELHRIAAFTAKWNTASVRLLEKNGFTFEGTMRQDYRVNGVNEDSECYSLLGPEWNGGQIQPVIS